MSILDIAKTAGFFFILGVFLISAYCLGFSLAAFGITSIAVAVVCVCYVGAKDTYEGLIDEQN